MEYGGLLYRMALLLGIALLVRVVTSWRRRRGRRGPILRWFDDHPRAGVLAGTPLAGGLEYLVGTLVFEIEHSEALEHTLFAALAWFLIASFEVARKEDEAKEQAAAGEPRLPSN